MPAAAPIEPVLHATLGGLVHDLGKPWSQAAGRPPEATRFDCDRPSDHRSVEACPSCRRYKYAHGPLAATLLRDALPRFAFLQQLALAHHADPAEVAASGPAMRYVVLGDRLSAGERDDQYDRDEAPRVPALVNPFAAGTEALVEPGRLSRSDALLRTVASSREDVARRLAEVVEAQRGALEAAGRFAGDDVHWLVDHLSGAVEASTSLVPSAFWRTVADISLASHLQFAAAFAGALAAAGVSEDFDPERSPDDGIATLIMGDLSGIQSFIHRVASKRAARSLRARSFYLTVLSTVVARFFAEGLGVTSANVLSSVGGNFLVLGPRGCGDRLDELVATVDRALADVHGPALSVSVAAIPLTWADAQRFADVLRGLRRELRDRKARRAERTAASIGLFEPGGEGGPLRACRSCGDDAQDGVADGDERVCRFCSSLENLGRELPASSYLTVGPADGEDATSWQRVARTLGYALRLHDRPPEAPFAGAIYALSPKALDDLPCARLLPSGRYVPAEKSGLLDFEELANRAQGRPLLAVLKADVDDLGRTFATHFQRHGGSVQSPSRIASFMRFLSLFFEGRVNELAELDFPNIYVVFAGGDDLAVVGPWNQVLDFAQRIRDEFARWTAENPGFHFSAGISFGDSGRPVMAALDEAERLLGKAKDQPGKDAVALLDERVLSWGDFAGMMDWSRELRRLVSAAAAEGGVARSLLQRLKTLDVLTEPRNGKVIFRPELWRAYYSLRRFAERHKAFAKQLDDVYEHALTPNGGLKLAIAARLAEFATTRGLGGGRT